MKVEKLFIELLQVALGNREKFSVCPSAEEWELLYDMAKKQALVGVCFFALKLLPIEQQPPLLRRRQWAVKAMRLEERNKQVTQECKYVTSFFAKGNYESCVLKGQSNTYLYPKGLRGLRTPGDIDLWVWEKGRQSLYDKKRLVEALWKASGKRLDVAVHHAECGILPNTPVEVHFVPSFAINPITDYKMRQFWAKHSDCIRHTDDGFYIPTDGFNLIFQMSHIFRHVLLEGIGFRQLIDYYFVLKSFYDHMSLEPKGKLSDSKAVMKEIEHLGMKRITSAVMWIMKDVFAMKDEYLLCKASEKYGRELLNEILVGGNFGQSSDEHAKQKVDDDGKETFASKIEGNFATIKRGMKLFWSYPSECFWVPYLCLRASWVRNYWRKVEVPSISSGRE